MASLFRPLSILSISPHMRVQDDVLIARTSLAGFLLSLTMLFRVVKVDRQRRRVYVTRRVLWLIKRQNTIPFDHIAQILYSYDDWSLTSSLDLSGNALDCFRVELRLRGNEDVYLFRFFGIGGFQRSSTNPGERWLPDWFYWKDRKLDLSGNQEGGSKHFVDLLAEYTGKPVAPG